MALTTHKRLTTFSIALIPLVFVGVATQKTVWAAEQVALPSLENTQGLDRTLSEEIGDDYIYVEDENVERESTEKPGNNTPGSAAETSANSTKQNAAARSEATRSATARKETDKQKKPQARAEQKSNNSAKPTSNAKSDDQATQDQQSAKTGSSSNAVSQKSKPLSSENSGTLSTALAKNNSAAPTDSVWHRITQSNRIPLADNKRVQFYADQYRRESLWISKILHRGSLYLSHLVSTLDQRFLPVELALLPAIESGYLPYARSSGSAVGLWQIVPITAKEIGIRRDVWFDGRGDILTSTTAAIDYLSYLSAEFNGDWELTLAAYNAGPGRVRAAVRKNAKAGLPTDYWSLTLPEETLNYVPKIVALIKMIKQEGYGGLDMPALLMDPAFESIDIGFRVSIDKAAKIAGVDEEILRALNAGLIHGVTPPDGPHHLLIPANTGGLFQQAFAKVDKNAVFSEPTTHDVVAGDSISSIAKKYGISQQRLLTMNGLDDSRIQIGQKLRAINANKIPETAIEYEVAIGDTLSEIADTFSVKIKDISHANGEAIKGDTIHPGDKLNIIVTDGKSG